MSDELEECLILCARKDQMKKPLAGRVEGKCSGCGATIWVAKDGLDIPKNAKPICHQ